jgi:acyl transferase domain-containing protein
MDPVGHTSDKIADQRAQIRAALAKHAPALVEAYDAAVRLSGDETFPWRLRLVAHAVREIANALPEALLGAKARPRVLSYWGSGPRAFPSGASPN